MGAVFVTGIAALEPAVLLPSVISVALTVAEPPVSRVIEKEPAPATRAAFGGSSAFASDEVMPTVSLDETTAFQLASTACTVTVNGAFAVWTLGLPVLPVGEPGAAASPGTRTRSFTK